MSLITVCRLCKSSRLKEHFVVKKNLLLKCLDCDFIQVAEEPSSDTLKHIYSDVYFKPGKYADKFALSKEHNRRLKILKKYLKDGQIKMLDVGCAGGEFIFFVRDLYNWWGTDISDYAVEQAKKLNPSFSDQLTSGPIDAQHYPDNFFDGIVAWDVIEHLWNPLEICEQLFRCLKPGGYLIISTPNINSFTSILLRKYWAFMTPPEHLSFFNRKNFNYLFQHILKGEVVYWKSKGKWANIGFILYKIKRIVPKLMPQFLIDVFGKAVLKNLSIYVPTADIQYVVARKLSE